MQVKKIDTVTADADAQFEGVCFSVEEIAS
jgi:hypothetical protein